MSGMGKTSEKRAANMLIRQMILASCGLVLLSFGVFLEALGLRFHSTSTVTKVGDTTVTTAGPSAPPDSLVVGFIAAGVLLLVMAMFCDRVSKLSISGFGEIDLENGAALAAAAAEKAGGDVEKTKQIYRKAAPAVARVACTNTMRAKTPSLYKANLYQDGRVKDEDIGRIVSEAAATL